MIHSQNTALRSIRKHRGLIALLLIFGVIYSLISLVNHYNFRTGALDLGLYTNALYDYIHFQWNDSSTFKMINENLLADHFDIYLILISPLSLILGNSTLLIVQIGALLLGGIGVYAYFREASKTTFIATSAALYFFSFFGVLAAVSFDYHSNVVAAAALPWFFYWVKKRNLIWASLVLLFILISKENIALWMSVVCLGLLIQYRRETRIRNFLAVATILCGLYFVTVISVIMPALSQSHSFTHFDYAYLGATPTEAIGHLVQHPWDSFKTLFVNHLGQPEFNYIKAELHWILLFSGLPFLFWKPHFLLMLLPIYFQKLYHDNYYMWGIGLQYNIEFAPLFALGIFEVVSEIKASRWKNIAVYVALIMVIGSAIRTMDSTIYYTQKSKIRFYQADHYKRDYDVKEVHRQLSMIPKDAVVCAHSPFLPHLAWRDYAYEFPRVKDAEYIIYSRHEDFYINSKEEFESTTSAYKTSPEWEVIYDRDITILKHRKE